MKLKIAWIGKSKDPAINSLAGDYLQRLSHYAAVETLESASEAALLKQLQKSGRAPALLVLLDQRGRQLSSEELADFLEQHQTRGTQALAFAIGPAGGFTDAARSAASTIISFGCITLPHELARVVLLEQLYRAFTILKGHPYHRK